MRVSGFLTAGVLLLATAPLPAQVHDERTLSLKEWPVEFGGQTRDPFVASDGRVWFVAQQGNYLGVFDPTTERFTRHELERGTVPHDILEDREGFMWYGSLGNGHIGKVDPATGRLVQRYETGAPRVNTMIFDQREENLWFTTGNGNADIGRLQMSTGKVDLVTPIMGLATRPYGIDVDPSGRVWSALFNTNVVAAVDPSTLDIRLYRTKHQDARPRRNTVTADGMVWYGDYPRGRLARINPTTGEVKEWLAPGGEQAAPYGIIADDQGRIWFSETGEPKRVVGFDPRTESFFAIIPVSGTIRNFFFDKETGMLWFGTDANYIGRILTRNATS